MGYTWKPNALKEISKAAKRAVKAAKVPTKGTYSRFMAETGCDEVGANHKVIKEGKWKKFVKSAWFIAHKHTVCWYPQKKEIVHERWYNPANKMEHTWAHPLPSGFTDGGDGGENTGGDGGSSGGESGGGGCGGSKKKKKKNKNKK